MSPAAIATTLDRSLGTLHCPQSTTVQPQAATVPSLSNARLWNAPADTAVTPERLLGTLHCPASEKLPQPHATTVPLTVARAAPAGRSRRTPSAASMQSLLGDVMALSPFRRCCLLAAARLSALYRRISRPATSGGARGTRGGPSA